jgi:hypothetical protein
MQTYPTYLCIQINSDAMLLPKKVANLQYMDTWGAPYTRRVLHIV